MTGHNPYISLLPRVWRWRDSDEVCRNGRVRGWEGFLGSPTRNLALPQVWEEGEERDQESANRSEEMGEMFTEKSVIEVERETYGQDGRAINKHSERTYITPSGNMYLLSRTLDGISPFFEACGPYPMTFKGLLPRLHIGGKEYWGDGMSWKEAERTFKEVVIQNEVTP